LVAVVGEHRPENRQTAYLGNREPRPGGRRSVQKTVLFFCFLFFSFGFVVWFFVLFCFVLFLFWGFLFGFFVLFFETGLLCVALAVLELTL
jgi:4-hydroxybenzoate polyprenyltransferase